MEVRVLASVVAEAEASASVVEEEASGTAVVAEELPCRWLGRAPSIARPFGPE